MSRLSPMRQARLHCSNTREGMATMNKFDIYYCDLGNGMGSEQSGICPCIILQNNKGNRYSSTTIIAPIAITEKELPTHYRVKLKHIHGAILLEQIRVLSKQRIIKYCETIEDEQIQNKIDEVLKRSLSLN